MVVYKERAIVTRMIPETMTIFLSGWLCISIVLGIWPICSVKARPASDEEQTVFARTRFVSGAPHSFLWVMDADGSNQRFFLDRAIGISWSPDGQKALISRENDSGFPVDICVMNADGSDIRNLELGSTFMSHSIWSPDGTRIALDIERLYFDNDYISWAHDIFVVDADGSNLRQITDTPYWETLIGCIGFSYPAVEPCGRLLSTWGKIKHFSHCPVYRR